MIERSAGGVTQLLAAWRGGSQAALEELARRVQPQLERIAANHFSRERSDHTLEPAALVNEAWLRLVAQERATWTNRSQFFAVASRVMRRILVDHARARGRDKRRAQVVTLADAHVVDPGPDVDALALDDALSRMQERGHGLEAEVVLLRFFGGFTVEETAAQLEVSASTVARAWTFARAWLCRELHEPRAGA